jgi:hypothetical protein
MKLRGRRGVYRRLDQEDAGLEVIDTGRVMRANLTEPSVIVASPRILFGEDVRTQRSLALPVVVGADLAAAAWIIACPSSERTGIS